MTHEQVWIVLEALNNVLTDSDSLLFLVLGQQLGDHLCAHLAHFEIFSDDAPDSVLVDGKFLSNHPHRESTICFTRLMLSAVLLVESLQTVDSRIRSRDQTAESSVEKFGITKTKESKDVKVEGQGDAHRVF